MEPSEVRDWLRRCPICIRMNTDDTYDVPSPEFTLVSDYSVAVLTRENGRMLSRLLALVNISEIVDLSESAEPAR